MKKFFLSLFATSLITSFTYAQNRNSEAGPNTGPVPDYSNLEYWAASPFKDDNSDKIPACLKNEIKDTRADVFFIHPTSYFGEEKTSPWNADLRDTTVNNNTDNLSILLQATVFNGSCRIFVPRYRPTVYPHLSLFL